MDDQRSKHRPAYIAGLAAFLGSLVVYLASLAPSLPLGHDSGEFITAAAVLGIPHPPGYPLYPILGHLFSYLPLADIALRLNLMSALLVAGASGLLGYALARAWDKPLLAAASALSGAFAVTVWRQAVIAEKYALHLFLVAVLVVWSAHWLKAPPEARQRLAPLGAALFGLALSYHYTTLLLVPGFVLLLWFERPSKPSLKIPAAFLLGLLPTLYLPLRASQGPPLNWGDPSNLDRFLWVVLRRGYGGADIGNQAQGGLAWGKAGYYFQSLGLEQFPWGLALLGLLGCWFALRDREALGLALAGGWLFSGPFLAVLARQPEGEAYNDILERLLACSYLLWAGLICLGLSRLPSKIAKILAVLAVLLNLGFHWSRCDQSQQYHLRDTATAVLDRLPQDAVLLGGSDVSAGALLYLTVVEKKRPDVTLVFPGLLSSQWYRATLPEGLASATNFQELAQLSEQLERPLYAEELLHDVSGTFVPRGLVMEYISDPSAIPARGPVDRENFEFLESRQRRGNYLARPGRPVLERYLINRWANEYRTVFESLPPTQALICAERVVALEQTESKDWIRLGQARLQAGDQEGAEKALLKAYALEPGSQDILKLLSELYTAQGLSEAEWLGRLPVP